MGKAQLKWHAQGSSIEMFLSLFLDRVCGDSGNVVACNMQRRCHETAVVMFESVHSYRESALLLEGCK